MSNEETDAARQELASCEHEIAKVKALLRALGPPPAVPNTNSPDDAETNSLTVSWIKTEGLPEAAQAKLTLQLSSPVEEAVLTKTMSSDGDEETESSLGSKHTFRGVETGQATLSISASDLDIPLGTSTTYDLSPLLKFDATAETAVDQIVKELSVDIFPPPSETTTTKSETAETETSKDEDATYEDAKEEVKSEAADDENKEKGDDKQPDDGNDDVVEGKENMKEITTTAAATNKPVDTDEAISAAAICAVTLKLTFVPSSKDRREELYEVLNKITQRKSNAVEKLRKAAVSASRLQQQQQSSAGSGSGTVIPVTRSSGTVTTTRSGSAGGPAVKAGFLNKPKKESRLVELYNKYLGPQSLTRIIVPVAANYVIFVGTVLLMHFKGQLLALPPPV